MSYDDKSVNTLWSQSITSPAAAGAGAGPCINYSAEDEDADSLMARRRRRRERAQTAYIMHGHGQSLDGMINQSQTNIIMMPHHQQQQQVAGVSEVEGHQMTLAERRMLRAAAGYSFHSVDNDDVFYDALNNSSSAHKPQQSL